MNFRNIINSDKTFSNTGIKMNIISEHLATRDVFFLTEVFPLNEIKHCASHESSGNKCQLKDL